MKKIIIIPELIVENRPIIREGTVLFPLYALTKKVHTRFESDLFDCLLWRVCRNSRNSQQPGEP
jgi:hypothetical protein